MGRTLQELGLMGDGVRVVAVVRGGLANTDFGPDFSMRVGDTLVLTGNHAEKLASGS